MSVSQAAGMLKQAEDILILTHRRPDGDTTGCAGALCRGLRQLGKTAYVLPNPEITRRYAPLIDGLYPPERWQPRFVVTTDIADFNLFPDNALVYQDRVDLAIDHHRSNPGIGRMNLVRPEAGACAEIVYDVMMALGITLTEGIARCIYVAASTDTGCFKYSNTVPHTLRVAAACLETGLDGGEINRELFEVKSWPRFQMERIIFDTMTFFHDKKIALATLYRKDINRVGADMDDLDAIAALPRQIDGVQAGLTLTENEDGSVKASVRTTKEIDASAICRKCGGGGHLRAGGASFPPDVDMPQAIQLILQAAEEVYQESRI